MRQKFGLAVGHRLANADQSPFWAALTAWTWYAFGLLPLQLALIGEAGLDAERRSSAIASAWLCAAVATIVLSMLHRQPISFSVPSVGLIFLKSLVGTLPFEQILGATMLAGLVMTIVALAGVSARVVSWLPPSIVMAMFAGVVLDFARRAVGATLDDLLIAGATVAGFAFGRTLGRVRIPPMGLAVAGGGVAIALTRTLPAQALGWVPPHPVFVSPELSASALLAVTLPLVLILLGTNLIPACAFLSSQQYRPPTRQMILGMGLAALVAPLFCGFAAAPSRDGGSIMAGPDAGPTPRRYVSTLVGGTLMLVIAFAASTVVALATILPASFIITLTGLSMLGPLQSALGRAFGGTLLFGPTIAFVVAMAPFTALALPSSCWALILGIGASWIGERAALRSYWRDHAASHDLAPGVSIHSREAAAGTMVVDLSPGGARPADPTRLHGPPHTDGGSLVKPTWRSLYCQSRKSCHAVPPAPSQGWPRVRQFEGGPSCQST
jgi:benzoate membrane transport protein